MIRHTDRSTVNKSVVKYITLLTLFLLITVNYLSAYPTGVSGFTKKTSTLGCGTCHGTHGDPNTAVMVQISGPAALTPGQQASYTVKISGGTGTAAGVDIAASNGTLANKDNFLKVLNSELTHPSAQACGPTGIVYNFTYTAPTDTGTQTLYATGVSSKSQWNFANNFTIAVRQPAMGVDDEKIAPDKFALAQNYPNPFNPSSVIEYSLPRESMVKLIIYNTLGEVVKTLVEGIQTQGIHNIRVDAGDLSSGIYLYSMEAVSVDKQQSIKLYRKMSLIK